MLRGIAYVSSASRDLLADDLEFIVRESRRFNEASGVTGVLLYCDGNFMQYFEGEDAAVAATWARIRASARHHHVSELMDQPIDEREFAGWGLGFAQATPDGLPDLAARTPIDDRCGPGADLLKTFWLSCRGR